MTVPELRGPKTYGIITDPSNSDPQLVMSTISKRKQKHSDMEAYYRNESKRFDLVRL
jgi:hypothetical protein